MLITLHEKTENSKKYMFSDGVNLKEYYHMG